MKPYVTRLFLAAALLFAVNVHAQLIDPTFTYSTGFNDEVHCIAIQTNDKILAGGSFTSYDGTTLNGICRLNADGSLDATFDPGTGFDADVNAVALQSDGKIIVGGAFTTFNGTPVKRIVRLHADGSLDTDFTPGTGFDDVVRCIVVQADDKILAGGDFATFNGTAGRYFVRLNADGSRDTGFNTNFDNSFHGVYSIAMHTGNKILVGGDFSSYSSIFANSIARLNTDGSLDNTFNSGMGFNSVVNTIVVQPDGKILAGGSFSTYNDVTQNSIARLNTDGSLDTDFNTGTGFDIIVYAIALQQNGKILAAGSFSSYNDVARSGIARLNAADGSLDNTFDPGDGFYGYPYSMALQSTGKIVLGGSLTYYNLTQRNYIIRLQSCSAPTVTQAAYNNTFCMDEEPFTLTGGSPAGGTYSGEGVSAGKFDPVAAGFGSHTITYTYADANACINTASTDIVVSGICMDVASAGVDRSLSIYPNPSNGSVTVSSVYETGTLEVYNNMGVLVYTAEIGNDAGTCNLSHLAKGIYMFHVRHDDNVSVQKVVMQ